MHFSMNIENYSIFFIHNVDIDILVFLQMFPCNEGVNMVPLLKFFLPSTCAFNLNSFKR
jgi:hypothetical protein